MKKTTLKTTQQLPIVIIGMGMSPDDLTAAHLRLIEEADLLVGGRRHLSLFKDSVPETYEVTADLKSLVAMIKGRTPGKRIVVLASGDPLYYGIGAYLVHSLSRENVRIYPNITSVAAAFARMGEPWQDVQVVSLHGRRQEDQLRQALRTADRIAVFTDPNCTPQWVSDFLRQGHARDFHIGVFEKMGSDAEQVSWHTTESIAGKDFDTPNMVILKRVKDAHCAPTALHLGMPESAYDHERGLITKAEVRVVSLARLSLMPGHILWDWGRAVALFPLRRPCWYREGKSGRWKRIRPGSSISASIGTVLASPISTSLNRFFPEDCPTCPIQTGSLSAAAVKPWQRRSILSAGGCRRPVSW